MPKGGDREMKKLLIGSMMLAISVLPTFAADFKGYSAGAFNQYFPDIQPKHVELFVLFAKPGSKWLVNQDVPNSGVATIVVDKSEAFTVMRTTAEKYADANGYKNCAASNVTILQLAVLADLLFW